MDDLSGRVAVITGGGRGIGRAISLRLARAGAAVAIGYRRDEAAARGTCAEIVASGGQATAYRASVEEPEQVRAMTEQVLSDFGGVDIVVCNAGIASRGLLLADTEPAELSRSQLAHDAPAVRSCSCVGPVQVVAVSAIPGTLYSPEAMVVMASPFFGTPSSAAQK